MSQVVPAAPPLPPIKGFNPSRILERKDSAVTDPLPSDECLWALKHPDVRRGCYFSRVCQYTNPKSCHYNDVPSILQVNTLQNF